MLLKWDKMVEIRRKLYKRGSSYETTIPMPLLFAVDKNQKHNVVFKFDKDSNRWYVEFEEAKEKKGKDKSKGGGKKWVD